MILINAFSEVTVIAYLSVMQNKQEQLDEVELIQAMSKEGEFDWEDDLETGTTSWALNKQGWLDELVNFVLPDTTLKLASTHSPFENSGIISGTMTISVQLDHPVLVKLIRKEKVVEEKLVADGMYM